MGWHMVAAIRVVWREWAKQQLGSAGNAWNRVLLPGMYIFIAINGAVGESHVAR